MVHFCHKFWEFPFILFHFDKKITTSSVLHFSNIIGSVDFCMEVLIQLTHLQYTHSPCGRLLTNLPKGGVWILIGMVMFAWFVVVSESQLGLVQRNVSLTKHDRVCAFQAIKALAMHINCIKHGILVKVSNVYMYQIPFRDAYIEYENWARCNNQNGIKNTLKLLPSYVLWALSTISIFPLCYIYMHCTALCMHL